MLGPKNFLVRIFWAERYLLDINLGYGIIGVLIKSNL